MLLICRGYQKSVKVKLLAKIHKYVYVYIYIYYKQTETHRVHVHCLIWGMVKCIEYIFAEKLIKFIPHLKQSDGWQQSNGCGNKLNRVITIRSNLSVPLWHFPVTYTSFTCSNLTYLNDPVFWSLDPAEFKGQPVQTAISALQVAVSIIKLLFLIWTLWPLINPSLLLWELSPAAHLSRRWESLRVCETPS